MAILPAHYLGISTLAFESGTYSICDDSGITTYTTPPAVLPLDTNSERWDYDGTLTMLSQQLDYEVIQTEHISNLSLIYAYAPSLPKSINCSFGKINLMICLSGTISVGYPYLDGWY